MPYGTYSAGTMKIRGTEFGIMVTDDGTWTTEWNGVRYSAATRDALKQRLSKETAKAAARISVPFTMWKWLTGGTVKFMHGELTGIHGGTNNLLRRWRDGKSDQDSSYSSVPYLRRLTSQEEDELRELMYAERDARKALEEYISERKMDARKAVAAELEKALKEGGTDG